VPECDLGSSVRRKPLPTRGCCPMGEKKFIVPTREVVSILDRHDLRSSAFTF